MSILKIMAKFNPATEIIAQFIESNRIPSSLTVNLGYGMKL